MVNWQSPALLLNDYYAFAKLNHAIAGLYIWETVFTAGFELDVLRGKRPYRWTIWIYLGTRYTGLLAFIFFLIDMDGPRLPCHSLVIAIVALIYTSWALASFIIVLRVMAIWSRNIIVSIIAVGVWLGGFSVHLWSLTVVDASYNPIVNTCIYLNTRRSLFNASAVFVVDVVLLLVMLLGLLRHAHKSATGIWKFLYQQCIIWLALAATAEIPPVVFLLLDLNDVWNEMFAAPAIAILSIAAARMYRSLSDRGSFTQYESSEPPQFSPGSSIPSAQGGRSNTHGPMRFQSVTQSEGSRTTYECPVFLPADYVQVEFVPSPLTSSLARGETQGKANSTRYEAV